MNYKSKLVLLVVIGFIAGLLCGPTYTFIADFNMASSIKKAQRNKERLSPYMQRTLYERGSAKLIMQIAIEGLLPDVSFEDEMQKRMNGDILYEIVSTTEIQPYGVQQCFDEQFLSRIIANPSDKFASIYFSSVIANASDARLKNLMLVVAARREQIPSKAPIFRLLDLNQRPKGS